MRALKRFEGCLLSDFKHRVSFHPPGRGKLIDGDKTLQEAAAELGIGIESLCGGKQKCGKCKVVVEERMESLSPLEESEKELLTDEEIDTGYRLSCMARVLGPVSVFIPEESRASEMVILEGGKQIKIEPDTTEELYGMAFDIGTTTVVGYLTDLKSGRVIAIGSTMNPQVAFGEDVMTRIAYTTGHSNGLEKLHSSIVDALNEIIKNAASRAKIKPADITKVTAVGNTAMHHIFLNIDPKSLGVSPFSPVVVEPVNVKAKELGLDVGRDARIHVLPNVAGFVGADNVAVLIASEPYSKSGATLTIDVGTNGEIVLCKNKRMMVASCATGPALEGAHIKHGMRAKPGAIEHLKIDPKTRRVRYQVIGNVRPTGICGSGVIDAVAGLFKAGVLQKNGRFDQAKTDRLRKGRHGYEFVIASKKETAIRGDIVITQKDVSEVQLAKAALYAGAKILMKRANVAKIDRIFLAGAFGSHIDPASAMAIGMFPKCPLKNIRAIGNAAGDGARIALINAGKRAEAEKIARKIRYIELTVDPDFETEFVNAMHLPHRTEL
jgi:uncharacterized 2Fe-2S/4Fe-4S cluster protein (DUF4445 family)